MLNRLKSLIFGLLLLVTQLNAQNPISPPGTYIADPTARVWDDGKLYIYGSLDESCDYYCSKKHHALSSENMIDWTLHENIFSSIGDNDEVQYNDNYLYAPSISYKDGKYYLYYCQPDRKHAEGVAFSNSPLGPFKNGKAIKVGNYNEIDPDVFIDDDGQAYYCWGQFSLKMAKLNPDMISIDTNTIIDNILTEKEHYFHEGAFILKIHDLYYMIYADISRADAPTCLGYATSENPFGPYEYRGVIIDNNGCNPNNWNNHGSVAKFNDQYYVFYHRSTHACNTMRKACVEPIEILEDGSIPEVEMTSQGAGEPLNAYSQIEAEWACLLSGTARITEFETKKECISKIANRDKFAFKYLDFNYGADSLQLRIRTAETSGKLLVSLDKPWHKRLATIDIEQTGNDEWRTITVPIENTEGVHALWLHFYNDDGEIDIDWFKFISKKSKGNDDVIKTAKPYARYWWFASKIKKSDVKSNLNWLKDNGFGGVEVAFVYPLNAFDTTDKSYTPRHKWLGNEWKEVVEYTITYADTIGMGCDLTFGTLWPFGDSEVSFDEATRKFGDKDWRQEIRKSWEHPKTGYVIDHLTPEHYQAYFNRLMKAFPQPIINLPQSYFIDSWEVETEHLWSDSFNDDFKKKFDYDIVPFMDSIYTKGYEDYLFDYSSLLSEKVIKFYDDFDSFLNAHGIQSRGQVSGAPCDLISGYAKMDIPESEAMLFEPEFSSIPASAALLSSKGIVSSETFTCLYGWPRDYIREEQTADLKLVADALFANGVNHIIWHGKPHNPAGSDSVNFYASVHLGSDGKLNSQVKEFNKYLETVSSYMRKGITYSDIAVYLPTEDAWMAGIMPKEKQFKWAWGFYEMRYIYFPEELNSYSPTWINKEFLQKANVVDNKLIVGDASYKALYIDAQYLEYDIIERLEVLADSGLKIIVKQFPKEPGINKHPKYSKVAEYIINHSYVSKELPKDIENFISGEDIPAYWCREEDNALYIFFSNPRSKGLKFPIEYGQSLNEKIITKNVTINYKGYTIPISLDFEPYQSLLYKIENGKVTKIDIEFVPETPMVKQRSTDDVAPWLVE